jgi:hypothetical protein
MSPLSDRAAGLPQPPLPLPLRVQLQARDGNCWDARYSTALVNGDFVFNARSG